MQPITASCGLYNKLYGNSLWIIDSFYFKNDLFKNDWKNDI